MAKKPSKIKVLEGKKMKRINESDNNGSTDFSSDEKSVKIVNTVPVIQEEFFISKIGQNKNNNNNKDLVNSLTPFTTGFALWQHFIIYGLDMYNEFVTDAAKLTEYWFNPFVNLST